MRPLVLLFCSAAANLFAVQPCAVFTREPQKDIDACRAKIQSLRDQQATKLDLARHLCNLGSILNGYARTREAEAALKESLALFAELPPPSHPSRGIALSILAWIRVTQGRYSEAERLYLDSFRVLEDAPQELSKARCSLAKLYLDGNRVNEAEAIVTSTLATLAAEDPSWGFAMALWAGIALQRGQLALAEQRYRKALDLLRGSQGPEHPTYAATLSGFAQVVAARDPREASRLHAEAIRILEAVFGPDDLIVGQHLLVYAEHLARAGSRKREAARLRRRGEAILAKAAEETGSGLILDLRDPRVSALK